MMPFVKPIKKSQIKKTLRWSSEAENAAVALAAERGYYPEKINGGVSRLIADLIIEEKERREKKEASAPAVRSRRASGSASPARANITGS